MKWAKTRGPPSVFCFHEIVESRTDEVERSHDRVLDVAAQAVSVDDSLEVLLAAGVDPPLLAGRPHDEVGLVFAVGARVAGLSVDLGRRVLEEPLPVLHAHLGDLEVLEEVQPDDFERRRHVDARIRVRDEIDDDVALGDELVGELGRFGDVCVDVGEVVTFDSCQLFVW